MRGQRLRKLKMQIVPSLLMVMILWLVPALSHGQSISSQELIANANVYDGKIVLYRGEIIGDIMRRGNFSWLNLADEKNVIGVWLPSGLLKAIAFTGSYRAIGDSLEVTGVLHRACPEHGGDLDIHATAITKTANGRVRNERINTSKRDLAVILSGVLFLVWILRLLTHR
jgi:hypothetical protein